MKVGKEIDAENENTLLMNPVKLEMKNDIYALYEYNGNPDKLEGYQEVTAHIVFDIRLVDKSRRKARFVGDGYKVDAPSSIIDRSVVLRGSVRIIMTIATLNEL